MKSRPPEWAIRTKADVKAIEEGCYWDQSKADAICKFAETFFRSQFISGRFRLLRWQRRLLQSVIAWRNPDSSRRWNTGNLHCSKKQGKTLVVAILVCWELFCSENPSAWVCVGAASKENASQVFEELAYTILNGPLAEYANVSGKMRIEIPQLHSKLWTLASDGKRVHGYNASLWIADEAHVMDSRLHSAMEYAMVARKDGFSFIISTAGNNVSHWYHDVYLKSKRILSGDDLDISHYAEVYECDPDGDLEDPAQWAKCCPSLGTSFTVDKFRRWLNSAKDAGIGKWMNFQQLMLNRWVRPHATAWLDVSNFHQFYRHIPDEELSRYPCAGGIDLGETVCPSACNLVFELGEDTFFIKSKAWIASDAKRFREKTNLPKYETYKELEEMPGDMLNKNDVLEYIQDSARKYQINKLNFDSRSAYILMNDLEQDGFECERFIQKARYFDLPMRSFERAWKEGRIFHDGSEWLKYCLSNVRCDVNKWGEIAPHSGKSVDHIDAAVATLMAYIEFVKPQDQPVVPGFVW